MQEPLALALVLVGSFWAGTQASIAGLRFTNEVLEKVVLGKSGDQPLATDFRRHLLRSSWLPVRIVNGAVTLAVTLILVMTPTLAGQPTSPFAVVCYACAMVPFLACLSTILFGVPEYRYASRVIDGDERRTEKGSPR